MKYIKKYQNPSGSGITASSSSSDNSGYTSSVATTQNFSPYSLVGTFGNMLGSMIPTPNAQLNSNNQLTSSIRQGISSSLMSSGNPYAMAAGAIVMGIDKTGGFSDASYGLGRYDTANKIASIAMPGAGWFTGKTKKYEMSDALQSMSSSYGSTYTLGTKAKQNSGAKLVFGKGKANRMIDNATVQDQAVQSIQQDAQDDFLSQSSMSQFFNRTNINALYNNQGLARAAKFGARLERMHKTKDALKAKSFFDTLELPQEVVPIKQEGGVLISDEDFFNSLTLEVESFQKGGELNVIPEGALHARKHHMERAEKLTKKGIPVVSEGEGGELDQQAEIERNEIIFRLDVTKQIEDLYHKFKQAEKQKEKDELAIEAGKLLAVEIMENTDDRTGLIQTVV